MKEDMINTLGFMEFLWLYVTVFRVYDGSNLLIWHRGCYRYVTMATRETD